MVRSGFVARQIWPQSSDKRHESDPDPDEDEAERRIRQPILTGHEGQADPGEERQDQQRGDQPYGAMINNALQARAPLVPRRR